MKDEKILAAEAAAGSHAAFEQLLRPHRRGMLGLAYRMTGNEEEAKEVIQEALIKIYRYLHRYDGQRKFRNWAFQIVANASRDYLRKKIRRDDLNEGCNMKLTENITPETRFLDRELRRKIDFCLQDLSPNEKIIYILRERQGFSVKETAKLTGGSSTSVRTHLSRARKKIKSRFVDIYFASSKEKNNALSKG